MKKNYKAIRRLKTIQKKVEQLKKIAPEMEIIFKAGLEIYAGD